MNANTGTNNLESDILVPRKKKKKSDGKVIKIIIKLYNALLKVSEFSFAIIMYLFLKI